MDSGYILMRDWTDGPKGPSKMANTQHYETLAQLKTALLRPGNEGCQYAAFEVKDSAFRRFPVIHSRVDPPRLLSPEELGLV